MNKIFDMGAHQNNKNNLTGYLITGITGTSPTSDELSKWHKLFDKNDNRVQDKIISDKCSDEQNE